MNDPKINAYIDELGGVFTFPDDASASSQFYQAVLHHANWIMRDFDGVEVKVVLIDNPEVNAFAFDNGAERLIGLYQGTVVKLFNYFFTAVTDKRNTFLEADFGFFGNQEDINDAGRAVHLTTLAVEFIFIHELMHIFAGHCAWWQTRVRQGMLAERLRKDVRDCISSERYHALETLADGSSFDRLMSVQLLRVRSRQTFDIAGTREWYRSLREAMMLALFAADSALFLFDHWDWEGTDLDSGTHPPAPFRVFWSLHSASWVRHKFAEAIPEVKDYGEIDIVRAFRAADQAYLHFSGDNVARWDGLRKAMSRHDYLNRIVEEARLFEQELKQLGYDTSAFKWR